MAYTTRQLINDAYYISGIISNRLQTVSGSELEDGLNRLNAAIAMKNPEQTLVPYTSTYDGVFIQGVEQYFIPNLIATESMTFFIQTVRWSMVEASEYEYWGTCRAQNIESLPSMWYAQRTLNGTILNIYYLPNDNYPFQIRGKFSILPVQINQDLSVVFDEFYLEYLRCLLAQYLCEFNDMMPPPYLSKRIDEYESTIRRIGVLDFTVRKQSQFSPDTYLNYQDYRTGNAWRPV